MKSFFLSISMVLWAAWAGAQQLHFVYLQTDSRMPFYVMLNNKNYSSSSIGYVILPKLQNGEYAVKVGFPRSEQAEQEFLLQVRDNDQGFLVKDFGEKGYGLFNLQSLDIQYAGSLTQKRAEQIAKQKAAEDAAAAQLAIENQRKADSLQAIVTAQIAQRAYADSVAKVEMAMQQQHYADSLQQAKAALTQQNPTAINAEVDQQAAIAKRTTDSLNRVAEQAAQQQRTAQEAMQRRVTDSLNNVQAASFENERLERIADSTAKAQAAAIEKAKQTTATDALIDTAATMQSPVKTVNSPKLLQKTFTDSGWRYTYTTSGGSKEKIDVFIPVHKTQASVIAAPANTENTPASQPEKQPATQPVTNTTQTNATNQQTTSKPADTQFLDMDFGSNTPANTVVKTDSTGVKVLHNSNCRAMADEKDFLNARKKIAGTEGTEKMVAAAKKIMKEKCFSTEQIRNLSFLFLTDADRYQFLDAAYPFAVDAYRFNSLQDLLKDDYYLQRFKAMLR